MGCCRAPAGPAAGGQCDVVAKAGKPRLQHPRWYPEGTDCASAIVNPFRLLEKHTRDCFMKSFATASGVALATLQRIPSLRCDRSPRPPSMNELARSARLNPPPRNLPIAWVCLVCCLRAVSGSIIARISTAGGHKSLLCFILYHLKISHVF